MSWRGIVIRERERERMKGLGRKEGRTKIGTGRDGDCSKEKSPVDSDPDNYPRQIHVSPRSPHSQSGKLPYGNTLPRPGSHDGHM